MLSRGKGCVLAKSHSKGIGWGSSADRPGTYFLFPSKSHSEPKDGRIKDGPSSIVLSSHSETGLRGDINTQ